MKTTWIAGLVVVIALVGIGLFASSIYTGQVVNKDTNTGETMEVTVTVGPNSEYSFDKTRLNFKQGDSVKVTFRNTGRIIHNWVLPRFNAATAVIQPGSVSSTQFIAGAAGNYEYFCNVPGHKERGMLGALTVSS